jgi:hypothetical protein
MILMEGSATICALQITAHSPSLPFFTKRRINVMVLTTQHSVDYEFMWCCNNIRHLKKRDTRYHNSKAFSLYDKLLVIYRTQLLGLPLPNFKRLVRLKEVESNQIESNLFPALRADTTLRTPTW